MTHDHSPVGEREDAREISETEAMQHARRNEVYRDVGSEPREPDAAEFIEVVVTSVDDEVALLLCSDGLSDMLSSLEINRIVRQHAGDPARVADALVDAANQAGGKDNITVLYVEAPRFAKSAGAARVVPMARQAPQQVATEALDGFNGTAVAAPSDPPARAGAAAAAGTGGSLLRSRALLLIGGVLAGVAAAVAVMMYLGVPLQLPPLLKGDAGTATSAGPRDLLVGGSTAGSFRTIGEALLQARDGDVVRVAPGRYPETLDLRRAVTLISGQPHAAALVVPPNEASWASLRVWTPGVVVRGFRIPNEGSPGHVGVRVHAGGVEIDDVVFEGAMAIGVDAVGRGSETIVRGGRFMELSGVPVQIGDGAMVTLRHNVFRAAARATGPAVACVSAAGLTLDSNTFMHFSGPPVVCATGPALVIDPRFVVPPPAAPRGRRR